MKLRINRVINVDRILKTPDGSLKLMICSTPISIDVTFHGIRDRGPARFPGAITPDSTVRDIVSKAIAPFQYKTLVCQNVPLKDVTKEFPNSEAVFQVPFNPTLENLALYTFSQCYQMVQHDESLKVSVTKVEVFDIQRGVTSVYELGDPDVGLTLD